MRISDWSSDVCSSDLTPTPRQRAVWRNHDDPDWSKTALIQRRIDRRAVTVAILAAQRDEALLHRGDPALHRGVVDTVVHLVRVALQVIEFPGVDVVAVKADQLVAIVAHPDRKSNRL